MTDTSRFNFSGFRDSPKQLVPVPESFFTQVLPFLSDLGQLRLLLVLIKLLSNQEIATGYLKEEDILSNTLILKMLSEQEQIKTALEGLVSQNIVLVARDKQYDRVYYFLNHPQAESAVQAINQGRWHESGTSLPHTDPDIEKPNIFTLYEDNIGVIKPMMAEILKDDEKTYPATWIEDAIQIAVTRNARNWKYVQAILDRWQKEGRGNEQNRRDDSQDTDRYRESWFGHK